MSAFFINKYSSSKKTDATAVNGDNSNLPYEQNISSNLSSFFQVALPKIIAAAANYFESLYNKKRIDGEIIGTGVADFTKQNSVYVLAVNGKKFQLIDVPGIEGEEDKYIAQIEKAIAKAHLVFYVNGTNKKPESKTAQKIRSYLRRGSKVCPVINVRGTPEAYEFDEDRENFVNQNIQKVTSQTVQVLRSNLPESSVLHPICVQGILAFCAVAYDECENSSTIHKSRKNDLEFYQKKFVQFFGTPYEMLKFSNFYDILDVIRNKELTFKEDIIESNKEKIIELLIEYSSTLNTRKDEYTAILKKSKPEFDKCVSAINDAEDACKSHLTNRQRNAINAYKSEMESEVNNIVAEYFGEKDKIAQEIAKKHNMHITRLGRDIENAFTEEIETYCQSVDQAWERLVEDLKRVSFTQNNLLPQDGGFFGAIELDMDLSLKNWGGFLLKIGSLALTGAAVGSTFGPVGTAIGAAVGAAVGLIFSVVAFFRGKSYRIRKAQGEACKQLYKNFTTLEDQVQKAVSGQILACQPEFDKQKLQVKEAFSSLQNPLVVLEQQILLIQSITVKIKDMPYGTILTI